MSKTLIGAAVRTFALLLTIIIPTVALAQGKGAAIKNIVLVHGAWADGSSWSKIIPLLTERGFNVVAVQNPLTSLQDDVTAANQAIERLENLNPGPVLLVGHSYGGAVITEAGGIQTLRGWSTSPRLPRKKASPLNPCLIYSPLPQQPASCCRTTTAS